MNITYKNEVELDEKIIEVEIIKLLLKNRNIENLEEFMKPKFPYEISLLDFGFEKELKKTVNILKKIKKNKGMIVVYTDYDADGITGGSIVWETLHLLGFNVMPYVPDRKTEGYGFSKKGIDTIKKEYDPSLIISVDHGITAAEKVTYAKSLGIPIIITDHHLKPEKTPDDAEAIFHIPLLSGSGVAYFFAKEIYQNFKQESSKGERLEYNFRNDYITLASIGTIADLVPLVGPSRSIVKYGLDLCTNTKRLGLQHIIKTAGIEGKKITPYEIGFVIAPRINAVGRLKHAIDALRLLCTVNDDQARTLAGQIGDLNKERQDLVKQSVEEAIKQIETQYPDGNIPKIIILRSDTWHEGIIGLIASKIVEKYYRPTLIMTKSDGFYKGSARSIPSFHITNFLRDQKKHLIDAGGHTQAAGFTIESIKVDEFIKSAHKKASTLIKDSELVKTLDTDLKIPLSKLSMKLILALEDLSPYGIGNPQPLFYSEAEVLDAKLFGKKNEHLKIIVKDASAYSFPLELIAFSKGDTYSSLTPGKKIEVVYSAEIDRWGGNEKLRGKIIYIQ